MKVQAQELSKKNWSSKISRVFLPEANDYNKKTYFNRYILVWDKVLRNFMRSPSSNRQHLIDCACGDGSGSAFIAEMFSQWNVLGVDIDIDSIQYANNTYISQFKNLKYECMSITNIKEKADVFVCLETIEHISKEMMIKSLENISSNILLPGGKLVISTPRKRPREYTVKRPSHINELYHQEFKYLLGAYFPVIDFYSLDGYANLVPDSPDSNCQIAICTKWPETKVFGVKK